MKSGIVPVKPVRFIVACISASRRATSTRPIAWICVGLKSRVVNFSIIAL